ncbi:MAG: EamA family transporter, partial [Bacteroidota bacterium]
AMWRMVLATIIYLPVAVAYWSKIDWSRWKPLLIVAFCGSALPNFFFAIAQQHVNSSLAGALNALTPLFTLVIGASFFRMKVSWSRFWGIVVGLSGAMALILFNSSTTVSG